MPLDIALSTNTATATIELRQAQALNAGRHLAAFLLVRSGAFAAALPFVFARDAADSFVAALDALYSARAGRAVLHGSENEDVIGFESGHGGELRVSGRLHEAGAAQQLNFNFVAEWEGLSSFIEGLRQLRAGDAQ